MANLWPQNMMQAIVLGTLKNPTFKIKTATEYSFNLEFPVGNLAASTLPEFSDINS